MSLAAIIPVIFKAMPKVQWEHRLRFEQFSVSYMKVKWLLLLKGFGLLIKSNKKRVILKTEKPENRQHIILYENE